MRKVIPTRLVLFAALCFPLLGQSTQKPLSAAPASERQLIAIKAIGSKRYSEADIAAATGLQIGTPVTDDDLKKAARRLGDMGVFTDVAYSYSYSAAGTKAEFKVNDGEKFVPVRFEDFVWFSDAELLQRIRQRAPLFDGQLPLSGQLAEEVSNILQGMLVERAIPGHVEFNRSGPNDGPVDSIVYTVSDVVIQVRDILFTGAAESEMAALKAASERLTNREYSRTTLNALVQKQLLPVYYVRGYLKAKFGTPEPKVVQQPSPQGNADVHNLTTVDVIFPVIPGQQYKLTALNWTGNHEFSTEQLEKMVRAAPGQPANTVKLADNLKDVQKLYGSRGYVSATITPQAEFDDAAGTVAIRLEVNEGAVYHMGDLEFRGLDNSLTAKLRNAWKIRPGEVYDATYLTEYLPAAHKLLPTSLDWEVEPHVTANIRDKTVDVDLIYSVKAPK
jgi:outer membrane protein insertion porin family